MRAAHAVVRGPAAPARAIGGEVSGWSPRYLVSLPLLDTAARPASSRAMGTRNGEQDT
jgi:hypothetical protein